MIKKLDRILVSVKIPKYDAFNLESLPNHIQLKSKNFISKFEASKLQHETKVESYLAALKETHKSFDVVKLNEIKTPITGYDLVVTLGGDGTFLRTAAFIRDETPIMGLNTDSERSYCAFCSYQPNVSVVDPKVVWRKLLMGDYSIINRTRMKISISGMDMEKNDEINEECEALNEIFFADRDVGKTSNFRLAVDNQEFSYQKSGGIIVSTGSGSTGWIKSARDIDVNTVIDIIRAREGKKISIEEAEAIAFRVTYKYMLAQNDPRLLYHVREPILQKMANYNGKPNSGIANEIKIQSELKNGVIVIDGNITRDVNFGEILHLTPSEKMLNCINFSLDRHDTLVKGSKVPTLKK